MTITQTIVREHEADLVVREARKVAEGVVAIILAAPDGAELPGWTPGAHIDFVLDDDMIRQYSLCGSPSKPDVWRVGVLRAPDSRGGSERVHDILAPGAMVKHLYGDLEVVGSSLVGDRIFAFLFISLRISK